MAWWILRGRSDWLFSDVLQVMKQRLEGRCFFWSICSCGSSGCRFFLAPSKGRADTAVAPFHFPVTERLLRLLLPPVCVEKGRAGGSSLCSQRPDFAGTSLLALLRAAVGVASERRMELSRSAFTRVVPLPPEQKKAALRPLFFLLEAADAAAFQSGIGLPGFGISLRLCCLVFHLLLGVRLHACCVGGRFDGGR